MFSRWGRAPRVDDETTTWDERNEKWIKMKLFTFYCRNRRSLPPFLSLALCVWYVLVFPSNSSLREERPASTTFEKHCDAVKLDASNRHQLPAVCALVDEKRPVGKGWIRILMALAQKCDERLSAALSVGEIINATFRMEFWLSGEAELFAVLEIGENEKLNWIKTSENSVLWL